jgi:beta-lactamase superfamily II metal-dependent hydrolase
MSIVKSLSVGNGDTFYIKHNSDNFTIIDCCISDENRERIIAELKAESAGKGVKRFLSTHPDEDHIQGIQYLDDAGLIPNFYCVQNEATKDEETFSFKYYRYLRDSAKAHYVSRGCVRRWMNESTPERGSSGINILWPNRDNPYFQRELINAKHAISYNNLSLVARYAVKDGVTMLWLGDLETGFMEEIKNDIQLSPAQIVFAPHHGRASGKIPKSWLDKLQPKIIVIGESPSRHLHYYNGYKTITQNMAGDITFECPSEKAVHIYTSNPNYEINYLKDASQDGLNSYYGYGYYKGTLFF